MYSLISKKLRRLSPEINIATACAGLLLFGFYLEYFHNLSPCPLCLLQRLCYFTILLINISSFLLLSAVRYKIIFLCLSTFFSLLGAITAGRQVWLQHLPSDQVPECGPGVGYLLEVYPLQKVLEIIYRGSGSCAETLWAFLGLSIAGWSAIFFVFLLTYSLASAKRLYTNQ